MSGIHGRGKARPVLLTALLASTALTGAAYGQAIETVVVTAEKRSEDMQKVPVSIRGEGGRRRVERSGLRQRQHARRRLRQ